MIKNKIYWLMYLGGTLAGAVTLLVHEHLYWMIGFPTQFIMCYLGYVWAKQETQELEKTLKKHVGGTT